MSKATAAERDYFARVARANAALDDDRPPASLAEMLERLEAMRRRLGALARPAGPGGEEADLDAHRAFLARLRAVRGGRPSA